MNIIISEIDKRYSMLASTDCCLSCGKAVAYLDINPGDICVDLGSGKGSDVLNMARSARFAYGIDISEEMVAKARKEATLKNQKNVRFLRSELEHIPLNDGIADHVISNCVLNHVVNKQAVWNEIHRILKPGGGFVISDIYATETIPAMYANDPVAVSECWGGSVTREIYLQNIKQAGFDTVEVLEESQPYEKGKVEVVSFTISGKKNQ
jgi:arsenite methyltransferase